jgi:hypothetical protein
VSPPTPSPLTVVPPPVLDAIAPDLVCDAQGDQLMTVTGTGFLTLGATQPVIQVGDQKLAPKTVEGCTAVEGTFLEGMAQTCTKMTFVIPIGTFPEGDYPVVVTNPPPADCVSLEAVNLHVAPPPVVTGVDPTPICDAQGDRVVTVVGSKFLQVGAALPTVTIGNLMYVPTAATGCTPLMGMFVEGVMLECTGLTVTIPANAYTAGDHAVSVKNPLPADCDSNADVMLHDNDPPVVNGVVPATLCAGGGALTFDGQGFLPETSVSLEAPGQATLMSASTMVNAGGTQLTASFGGGLVPGTVYDAVVDNHDGCTDALPHKQVTVVAGPIAFFADPEVVYNGINTRVTVYVTTLSLPLPANAVTIVPTGQAGPITQLDWAAVPNHPNRVQVVVPKSQAPRHLRSPAQRRHRLSNPAPEGHHRHGRSHGDPGERRPSLRLHRERDQHHPPARQGSGAPGRQALRHHAARLPQPHQPPPHGHCHPGAVGLLRGRRHRHRGRAPERAGARVRSGGGQPRRDGGLPGQCLHGAGRPTAGGHHGDPVVDRRCRGPGGPGLRHEFQRIRRDAELHRRGGQPARRPRRGHRRRGLQRPAGLHPAGDDQRRRAPRRLHLPAPRDERRRLLLRLLRHRRHQRFVEPQRAPRRHDAQRRPAGPGLRGGQRHPVIALPLRHRR